MQRNMMGDICPEKREVINGVREVMCMSGLAQ